MKKMAHKMDNMMFDLASGPTTVAIVGFPILFIVIVIILIIVAVKLIKNARKKRIEAEFYAKRDDSPGENR